MFLLPVENREIRWSLSIVWGSYAFMVSMIRGHFMSYVSVVALIVFDVVLATVVDSHSDY